MKSNYFFFTRCGQFLFFFWPGEEDEGVALIDQVFLGLIKKKLEPFTNEQLKK